jgi:hypothetical protein
MVPLRAASIEKGKPELPLTMEREKDGGSMRRNGEEDARRLERSPTRLCLGEPRDEAIGVELVVDGEDRALRTEGTEGVRILRVDGSEARPVRADWVVLRMNCEGLARPLVVLDRLVGELKMDGSMFSESCSSLKAEGL